MSKLDVCAALYTGSGTLSSSANDRGENSGDGADEGSLEADISDAGTSGFSRILMLGDRQVVFRSFDRQKGRDFFWVGGRGVFVSCGEDGITPSCVMSVLRSLSSTFRGRERKRIRTGNFNALIHRCVLTLLPHAPNFGGQGGFRAALSATTEADDDLGPSPLSIFRSVEHRVLICEHLPKKAIRDKGDTHPADITNPPPSCPPSHQPRLIELPPSHNQRMCPPINPQS